MKIDYIELRKLRTVHVKVGIGRLSQAPAYASVHTENGGDFLYSPNICRFLECLSSGPIKSGSPAVRHNLQRNENGNYTK